MLRAEERLRGALTARYQLLFSDIGRIEGGVKFLVDMRADIKVSWFYFPVYGSYTFKTTDENIWNRYNPPPL